MQIHQGCAPHRAGPLTRLWRIRAELLLAAGAALLVLTFAGVAQEGRWLPFALLGSAVTAPVVTRSGRNRAVAHFWCVVSRHRLRRVCLETPCTPARAASRWCSGSPRPPPARRP